MDRIGRRTRVLLLATTLALVATGCQRVPVPIYDQDSKPDLAMRYITRDGKDTYVLKTGPGVLRVSAPSTNQGAGEGANTRAVIWPPSTPAATDQQVCAAWTDAEGQWAQQGIALRVRIDGDRFRSVLVLKNVLYGAEWQFNVMTFDTGRSDRFKVVGAVILRAPFEKDDVPRPLPWRVCAKVEGKVVRVKGWRADETEPGWNSTSHAGRVALPDGWTYSGKAGWYAGHLPPGGTVGMSRMRTQTWKVVEDD